MRHNGARIINDNSFQHRQCGPILGNAAIFVGAVALVTNTVVMMFGFQGILPSPIAGGAGVFATVLLAICLFRLSPEK